MLFLLLGYYEYYNYEHLCTSFYVDLSFHFSWLYLLSICLILLVLIKHSLIHFCMLYTLEVWFHSLVYEFPVAQTPVFWKKLLFPHEWSWQHLLKATDRKYNTFIFKLLILFHCSICLIFMPILHCLDYCSFVVSFEFRMCEFSNFVLFPDHFVYSGFLVSHMNFKINLLISANKHLGFW